MSACLLYEASEWWVCCHSAPQVTGSPSYRILPRLSVIY